MKNIFYKFNTLFNYNKYMIILSFLGLIPFILGVLDLYFNKENPYININIPIHYGVIILTFLGSVYWGIILSYKEYFPYKDNIKIITLIWSITPAFLGIFILMTKEKDSLIILSVSYFICQIVDEIYYKSEILQTWYIILRRVLTVIVMTIFILSYLII
tara:strand:+ start:183 stop:659 length:477 start_codon:yes stop_codon:yes gene_type:complete